MHFIQVYIENMFPCILNEMFTILIKIMDGCLNATGIDCNSEIKKYIFLEKYIEYGEMRFSHGFWNISHVVALLVDEGPFENHVESIA